MQNVSLLLKGFDHSVLSSSPDPAATLELLQRVLPADKLASLINAERERDHEQLETLQSKLQGWLTVEGVWYVSWCDGVVGMWGCELV